MRTNWTSTRLKFLADCNTRSLPENTPPNYEFFYVDISNVTQGRMTISVEPTRFGDAPSRARRVARPGDSIVSTVRTYLRAVATVPETPEHLVFSTGFAVLSPRAGVESQYLAWSLQGDEFVSRVESRSTGVSYPAITSNELMSLELRIPAATVQVAISEYLDRETAQIDTLIREQQHLRELLVERRAQCIVSKVAGGLEPSETTKPSGLSWAPTVPKHWTVAHLTRFASMKTGHTPSRSNPRYWVDCDIPWFTLADVWQLRSGRTNYLDVTSSRINRAGLENSSAELLPGGTVVLSRTASVGYSGILSRPMATSQDFWNWVPGPKLHSEYLLWVLRAMRPVFDSLMAGSTHKTIYRADAAALRIPIPPIDEQVEIANDLAQTVRKLDALADESQRLINLSVERRSALITAAVTGQIDVGGAA